MTTRPIHLSRRAALGMAGAALALPRMALAADMDSVSGAAFGTGWRLLASHRDGAGALAARIGSLFATIDRHLSPWRPDSAISRFNAGAASGPGTEPALVEVTAAALDIASRSEGAFDPTVGPLVARWGFGPIAEGGPPDWRALSTGPQGVTRSRADLTLDLCGIAKGWALDHAAALVRGTGIRNALFDLGGEFAAIGQHPDGRDWRVAVEAPLPSLTSVEAFLRVPSGTAVATSGTRAQSYTLNGRIYSHIIDPGARAPTAGKLRSVTVVAPTGMAADGWATALCAAGDTAGPALATTHGIAALFLIEREGALRQVRTGPIADFLL